MKLLILAFLSSIFMNTDISYKTSNTGAGLYYLVREPKIKTDHPPLILLLHGVGSNERDLFSFADRLPANFLVVSARAPLTIGADSYAWFHIDYSSGKRVINKEQAEKSRTILLQFLEQLKTEHPYDAKQVYLCGFSQGGIMSYSVALTKPELIKGIAILSGRLLDEVKPLVAPDEQLKPLKIFMSHGTQDNVIGVEYARNALAYLKAKRLNPSYKEYVLGHGINNEVLTDLLNWLNEK